MSKLEKLIQQYCPDGVEWIKIKDIAQVGTGSSNGNEADEDGKYPFFVRSQIVKSKNDFEYDEEAIIIPGEGGIGDIFHYINGKYALHQRVYRIHFTTQQINVKFAFYYMKSAFKRFIMTKAVSATVTSIRKPMIEDFEIPVPPLPVQEEIVRVLDAFTELQAELQKRKQQYNFYLDNLLNFKNINRGGQEIKWMKLSDIGTFYSGLSGKTKDDFHDGNAKFISYVNIFNNPSLITDVKDRVRILEGENQNTIQYGDLLFTGSSETPDECGMCSVLTHHTEEKLYLNSFCFGFRFNDLSGINPEFMKFLFRSSAIRKLICKTANGVTRFNISKKEFAKIVIPIPSLKEQDHIASVLDKFYFLVGDLTSGLPAEIEKRRQQYEFYRDKLLTFKRKEA